MSYDLRTRLEAFYDYVRGQLGESSTITAIFTFATIAFGSLKRWTPGQIALAAASISALCKFFLPDDLWKHK